MANALRNQRGEPVKAFTASDAKNAFGQVLELAARDGMVAITRHEKPRAVLLSIDEYDALTQSNRSVLEGLKHEFDAMVAAMNAPGAGDRTLQVFSASPKDIGTLALKAARRARS